jgi:hypothetical protein
MKSLTSGERRSVMMRSMHADKILMTTTTFGTSKLMAATNLLNISIVSNTKAKEPHTTLVS